MYVSKHVSSKVTPWSRVIHECNKILGEKTEEKRPLGRTRRRWVYNIGMTLREIRWEGVGWMHLT
jgi:hypothetical protein